MRSSVRSGRAGGDGVGGVERAPVGGRGGVADGDAVEVIGGGAIDARELADGGVGEGGGAVVSGDGWVRRLTTAATTKCDARRWEIASAPMAAAAAEAPSAR